IETICCEDDSRVEGDLVNARFVRHFQNFLGTTFPVSPMSSMGDIVKLKLSEAKAIDMIKDVRRILGEINATLIALVPKIDTPNKVSDFRPIACCNVLYKCISKIITNRIKEGLSKVASLNQSAFIPGRHIKDNILITQELLKGYNRKNGAKRCAMKIDIQKAYDTISWEFLKEDMLMVGFHETMMHWIMTCITYTSFYMILWSCVMGDTESLKVVKNSLDDFSSVSGLFPNLSKNSCGTLVGLQKGKENVAWKNVYKPKEQGGLGFEGRCKWADKWSNKYLELFKIEMPILSHKKYKAVWICEAHLAPTQPTQVNKITTSCEICSGPHDTQYCLEDPEQAFVEYASLRTDEAGDARLSKFEADFKQQHNEMTNKIDTLLKAITSRIAGALPSDTVKNPKLSTSPVLSARSYPKIDPQCISYPSTSINANKAHSKEANISQTSLLRPEMEIETQ
nr:RNA-directed DNA polymerase, eukaryota, reverse transcriptase zinc-binding domain protein [Tanacetum cinerariifolium]